MIHDLSSIVSGWPYDPNEVRARWVQTRDGRQMIQLRLDLGVFQMEVDGRPDGQQVKGHVSLLDFYLAEEAKDPTQMLPYVLDFDDCAGLQQEAMQYYYRMMAFHALGDLPRVVSDSDHNLDLIDIVTEYADDDEIAWQFMQLYPYMLMMNVRARAELEMQSGHFDEASRFVTEAIADLENFYAENYEPENEDGSPVPPSPEMTSLRELAEQVEQRRPRSEAEVLREQLAQAVALENYEKAAFLRDRLKSMKGLSSRAPAKKRMRPSGGRENPS